MLKNGAVLNLCFGYRSWITSLICNCSIFSSHFSLFLILCFVLFDAFGRGTNTNSEWAMGIMEIIDRISLLFALYARSRFCLTSMPIVLNCQQMAFHGE
jgi:hypothetical protein